MRRITSLTAALTFIIVILTSVILYIVPHGRVAYWADWHLWGLSKDDWGNIHINTGLLFLIALVLHIYYNWKPLMAYLKDRAKQFKLFTKEFNIALTITIYSTIGGYLLLPPFNWVMSLNEHFKDAGTAKYGEPPYGHAELSSLKSFTKKMNLDLKISMVLLENAGFPIDNADMTLSDIGKLYQVPPQKIYQAIATAQVALPQTADVKNESEQLPEEPPPGSGNLTLADFCIRHDLKIKEVIHKLKETGISAEKDLTLKKIAVDNRMSPTDLYAKIKDISQ
ncbi:MAG: DUF4405 domain-containing protein [Desulfobacteraceae bacterium]|jgi:hypothetical protein